MFYFVSCGQHKCKSRKISSQFSPKREETGFKEMSISRSILKLESSGFWHNILFGRFWPTKCKSRKISSYFSPKRGFSGISRNEHISVNFQAWESLFLAHVLFGAFWAAKIQVSRNLVPVLAKTWINRIKRNEHISVNVQARESWFLAKCSICWVLSNRNASFAKSRPSSRQNVNKQDLKK
jgi:hypothetical protein